MSDLASHTEHRHGIKEECISKLESCWMELLRQMVNGGWSRLPTPEHAEETEYKLRYSNVEILHITRSMSLRSVIRNQYLKYIGHDVGARIQ